MINVLILGANGQLARHTTPVFVRDTDAKLTAFNAASSPLVLIYKIWVYLTFRDLVTPAMLASDESY
jgi:hypothetical protein